MQKSLLMVLLVCLGWSGVQAQYKAKRKIRKNFRKMLKEKDIHNGFVQIKSTDGALNWKFVAGTFQDGAKVTEDNPFHAASIGKMFTATVIMELAEARKLELDDSISKYLSSDIVSGLHVYEGKDYTSKITIAQLLQHTSGLPDYVMDRPKDGSPNLVTLMLQNPNKFWEVKELLAFSKEKLYAHFRPGEGYYYTDTEYLLLGLIIEKIYQKELHQVFLDVFFEPLEMKNTAIFKRSEAIQANARMAEFYVEQTDISKYESLSIDWAGGGLVTTTEDLLKFHQALFEGKIIRKSSLKKMQNWHKESKGTYYGFGLRKFVFKEFSKLLPNITIIGHSGSNSSFLFYCPELKIYITGTFNQTSQMEKTIEFLVKTLITLKFDY